MPKKIMDPMNSSKIAPRDFDEFRKFQFEEISLNPITMFNFFLTNNDVFQQITDDDMQNINVFIYPFKHKRDPMPAT